MYKQSTNDWAHFRIQNQKSVACPEPPPPKVYRSGAGSAPERRDLRPCKTVMIGEGGAEQFISSLTTSVDRNTSYVTLI